jgi:hypothetical protein
LKDSAIRGGNFLTDQEPSSSRDCQTQEILRSRQVFSFEDLSPPDTVGFLDATFERVIASVNGICEEGVMSFGLGSCEVLNRSIDVRFHCP